MDDDTPPQALHAGTGRSPRAARSFFGPEPSSLTNQIETPYILHAVYHFHGRFSGSWTRVLQEQEKPVIPYDKLTIVRNRHRARTLGQFRDVVEIYFDRTAYLTDEHRIDWEGTRAARAQINRMLPRVIEIVTAAGLGAGSAGPGPRGKGADALRHIFDARDPARTEEEILDLIDMTMGVYQANQLSAAWRTVNPLHYVGVALGFVLGLPRKGLEALGVVGRATTTTPQLQAEHVTRLVAVADRLADGQDSIETRLAEIAERQERRLAENADHLADLAERLEFAERVMVQQKQLAPATPSEDEEAATPV